MSREIRNGKRYYYRVKQAKGRLVKSYCGSVDVAEVLSGWDFGHRAKRELRLLAFQDEKDQFKAMEDDAREFSRIVDQLLAETLQNAGYQRHNRGEWRKSRTNQIEGNGNRMPPQLSQLSVQIEAKKNRSAKTEAQSGNGNWSRCQKQS
jgi:hypothetical protein